MIIRNIHGIRKGVWRNTQLNTLPIHTERGGSILCVRYSIAGPVIPCQVLERKMLKGDLSNKMLPRLVVVFEGAVGVVPDDRRKSYFKLCQKKRWQQAINCYELNDLMLSKLLDLRWRQDVNVNLVTWLGDEAAVAIQDRMDEEGIPVGGCFASTPSRLSRELAYAPDIIAVYDPDPDHIFTFGSKGIILTDVNQIGKF